MSAATPPPSIPEGTRSSVFSAEHVHMRESGINLNVICFCRTKESPWIRPCGDEPAKVIVYNGRMITPCRGCCLPEDIRVQQHTRSGNGDQPAICLAIRSALVAQDVEPDREASPSG